MWYIVLLLAVVNLINYVDRMALAAADKGHVGSALSLIEIFRVLYDEVIQHDPKRPTWPERDRVILSKGHGCLALYGVLADHGYFPLTVLDSVCARHRRYLAPLRRVVLA